MTEYSAPANGYDYVLVDRDGNEVRKGDQVTDRLGFKMWLQGYNHKEVFVSRDRDYPLLHSMAFTPDVYGLTIKRI